MLSSDSDDDSGGIRAVRRILPHAATKPATKSTSTTESATPAAKAKFEAVSSSSAAAASSSSSSTSTPAIILGANTSATNKLRTTFARESDELIEARKAASREPLMRKELSEDGGAESVDYYRHQEIAIPVRPDWHGLNAAQLEANETRYFNDWLTSLYSKYTADRLNHFEHNLEVWRQLWRVCERSDILLVVVDCRQPTLNFPPSLYHYITGTLKKPLILVLNKIDLIPAHTVNEWITYFHQMYPNMYVVPFTSFPQERMEKLNHLVKSKAKRGRGTTLLKPYGATELLDACRKIVSDPAALASVPESVRKSFSFDPTLLGGSHAVEKSEQAYAGAEEYMRGGVDDEEDEDEIGASSLSKELKQLGVLKKQKKHAHKKSKEKIIKAANRRSNDNSDDDEINASAASSSSKKSSKSRSRVRIGSTDEVHEYSDDDHDSDAEADESIIAANKVAYSGVLGQLDDDSHLTASRADPFITLGCLGVPNAGKSSLINALAGKKLVSVSKTPGHTKYLQTLFLNPATRLCDCPGLVFPAVDMPRALQVIAGSYPIAQTREPYSAVQFIAERLPLETIYKLTPPVQPDAQSHVIDPASPLESESTTAASSAPPPFEWSAWSLCEALATKKGFFNRKGDPDVYRAANFILREVLDGTITFFFTPPKK